jgi:hypothetical protein
MASPNYDDPKVEEKWCDERFVEVAEYLQDQGIVHGRIGRRPAWHVAPCASVWAIESQMSSECVGWWVICGDLPTDHVSADTIKNPREAIRAISKRWFEVSDYMSRGEKHPTSSIGTPETWSTLGPLLKSRAEILAEWTNDDEIWKEAQDQPKWVGYHLHPVLALPEEVFGNPISKEADEYLNETQHFLKVKQETFRITYLSDVTSYDVDLVKGIIRFERGDRPPLLMDVQVVGSVRHSDKSWEWAWHNPNIPHALSRDSAKVKEIGRRYDLRYLVRGLIPARDETFRWYLTGIALHESQALGVYVSHAQESDMYMLLTNPRDGAS